ncbi:MAG: acyl-CoA thioesterase II [Alphaproteobacteria bacterium]|jgi:acyl-CoA thioesterase-2
MNAALQELLEQLDLEQVEVNFFRGVSPVERETRVYGGHVMAQALMAGLRTVGLDRLCHSFHAYFLLGGDPKAPILYEVDRTRDGGSFTTRRIVAIQHGKPIFHMEASFHVSEPGWEHQFAMPDVPGPETLPTEDEFRKSYVDRLPERMRAQHLRDRPIEQREIDPPDEIDPSPRPPFKHTWIRANGALPDDPRLHQCLLAYASDMSLMDTAVQPHGISWMSGKMMGASLDHAMWFHHPLRIDDWLLYAHDAPVSAGGRGFNRGLIYTRAGQLVASVVQEGLMRPVKPKAAG